MEYPILKNGQSGDTIKAQRGDTNVQVNFKDNGFFPPKKSPKKYSILSNFEKPCQFCRKRG